MGLFNRVDKVVKPAVIFVLKVLGAFGACWGTFSSVDVTRKQVFGYSGDDSLMDNPIYSKVALGVSTGMAVLSSYLIIREQLSKCGPQKKQENSASEDVFVTIPLMGTKACKKHAINVDTDIEMQAEDEKASDLEVVCKRK